MGRTFVVSGFLVLFAISVILAFFLGTTEKTTLIDVELATGLENAIDPPIALSNPESNSRQRTVVLHDPQNANHRADSRSSTKRSRTPQMGLVEAGKAAIRVYVRRAGDEGPLAGFAVELLRINSTAVDQVARSSADGWLDFEVESGLAYTVRTGIPGEGMLTSGDVGVLADGDYPDVMLDVVIESRQRLFGSIVAARDGGPIGGASIRFASNFTGIASVLAETDASGQFSVEFPQFVALTITIEAEGFAPRVIWVDGADLERDCSSELLNFATLEVDVRRSDGSSAAGVRVRVSGSRSSESLEGKLALNSLHEVQMTDSNGRVSFEALPPDVLLEAAIVAEEFGSRGSLRTGTNAPFVSRPVTFALTPGETESLALFYGSGASIVGRVLDSRGDPVPYHPVRLLEAEADLQIERLDPRYGQFRFKVMSDELGYFRFDGVDAGAWWVRADTIDFAGRAEFLKVVPGERPPEFTLIVVPGLFIQGLVVDPNGDGLQAIVIAISDESVGDNQADSDGAFRLGPLLPGFYKVSALSPAREGLAEARAQRIEAGTSGVVIVMEYGSELWIKAVDEAGHPVEGTCYLTHELGMTGSVLGGDQMRLEQGEARFTRLLAGGPYAVVISAEDQIAISRGIDVLKTPPTEPIVLRTTPGARLEIRSASGEGGHLYKLLQGAVIVGMISAKAGESVAATVPVGEIVVQEVDLIGGRFEAIVERTVMCLPNVINRIELPSPPK